MLSSSMACSAQLLTSVTIPKIMKTLRPREKHTIKIEYIRDFAPNIFEEFYLYS